MTDGFETIGMVMVYGARQKVVVCRDEGGNRIKVQILINQQHREGEVQYLIGLISRLKQERHLPYATKNK